MNLVSLAYSILRAAAEDAGISVWDTHEDGPGVTIWRKLNKKYYPSQFLITIGYFKSKKKRLFVLAHELGHCTILKEGHTGIYLANRKTPSGEIKANEMAVKILSTFNDTFPIEFAKFYNWANRYSSRRKRMKEKR